MARDDRTVHARLFDGVEIVRYDRAGKWYAEKQALLAPRQHLTLSQAVAMVLNDEDAEVFHGKPGGAMFDRRVKADY